VCRLEGDSFAVVMPGLDEQSSTKPVHRIREALARLRGRQGHEGTSLEVTVGVGYWRPPMPAAQALDEAWKAMVAERTALRTQ
jgi:GGDEF domain-containing protein